MCRLTSRSLTVLAAATVASALAAPAQAVPSYSFSCTGIISRDYTRQTVTGTIAGVGPTNTTVLDYRGEAQVAAASPTRTNAWWGGYYVTTYAMNQWRVGRDVNNTVYHVMLPNTRPGAAFNAILVSEFGGARGPQGNWQNDMTCTAW